MHHDFSAIYLSVHFFIDFLLQKRCFCFCNGNATENEHLCEKSSSKLLEITNIRENNYRQIARVFQTVEEFWIAQFSPL